MSDAPTPSTPPKDPPLTPWGTILHFLQSPQGSALANFLQIASIIGVVYPTYLLTAQKDGTLLGVHAAVWTAGTVVLLFLVWLTLAVASRARKNLAEAARFREDLERRHQSLVRSLMERVDWQAEQLKRTDSGLHPRAAQREVFNAVRVVYGYWATKLRIHYTIHGGTANAARDGHAEAKFTITFECERPFDKWALSVSSRNGVDRGTVLAEATKNHVLRPTINGNHHDMIAEYYEIVPKITPEEKAVECRVSYAHRQRVFATTARPTPDREFDWVSFTPFIPIEELEIVVDFDGFRPPGEPCAEVTHGAADIPLPRETTEAADHVRFFTDDINPRMSVKIAFPILGAKYALKYRLPETVRPASVPGPPPPQQPPVRS